jgi:DNA-binding transcriptional MocR family regulator
MTATNWGNLYADRTRLADSEAIKEVLRLIRREGVISFAGGVPAPEMFPYDRVREVTNRVMQDDDLFTRTLQYGLTEGYPPLRQLLADEMVAQGVPCTIDNVLITTGSQ